MIPYLSASELGLLTSGWYCILTLIAYLHRDIPQRVSWVFFVATVFILIISKNPVITYVIDASIAKEVAYLLAIVAGVVGITAAWWLGHFDHSGDSPTEDPDQDNE